MRLAGLPLPNEPRVTYLAAPLLFVLFLVLATVEEVGWTGYATYSIQERRGALETSLILGLVGATWHLLPLV